MSREKLTCFQRLIIVIMFGGAGEGGKTCENKRSPPGCVRRAVGEDIHHARSREGVYGIDVEISTGEPSQAP